MLVAASVGYIQKLLFSLAGEGLTISVRKQLFTEIMYKNVAWFDRKSRAPGILSTVFSEDISNLNGLSTEIVGTMAETAFTLIFGISISAFYQWRMTLVCLAATPLVMLGGVLMARL